MLICSACAKFFCGELEILNKKANSCFCTMWYPFASFQMIFFSAHSACVKCCATHLAQHFFSAGGRPFPAGGRPFPAGGHPFPVGGRPFPAGGHPFPDGGHPFPAGRHPFPAGGHPFPAGGRPFPAGGRPFPAGGRPYPAGGRHPATVENRPYSFGSQPSPAGVCSVDLRSETSLGTLPSVVRHGGSGVLSWYVILLDPVCNFTIVLK
jgi:hypothetical protein